MERETSDETSHRAIDAADRLFVKAIMRGHAKEACSVYGEDAHLLVPSSDPIRGRGAIESYWQAGIDAGMTEMAMDPIELRRSDGFAYEIGRYSISLKPADGSAVVDSGSYLLVYQRLVDGEWRRQAEVLTPDGRTR